MKRIAIATTMIAVNILAAGQADAGENKPNATPQAKYEAECGSCHIAYPARFLNAETWQRLMGGLDKHFGDNAALDSEVSREILSYLRSNASSSERRSARSLRISDTAWFASVHHEISPRAWTDPAIKSRANCTACHINAARGDWSERGVRMPAGLGGEEGEEEEGEHDD
jgi:nitrate/TMAO reductase-like tetraheme cytochrome c subunit